MKLLRFHDSDFFWVATKIAAGPPKLLLGTYCADAPAWDIVPIFERLANHLGQRRVQVVEYDLQPVFAAFREVMELRGTTSQKAAAVPVLEEAARKLAAFGIDRNDFEDEEELLVHILSKRSSILRRYIRDREPRLGKAV
jgi:hypothetical protein